jgi:hypothetical protein
MLRNLSEITKDAASVTLEEALKETERETQIRVGTETKPGGVYNRWADAEPAAISKHRTYEKQTARIIAITQALSVMTENEWNRFQLRYQTLQKQLKAQTELF